MSSSQSSFEVVLSYQGQTARLPEVNTNTSVDELYQQARSAFQFSECDSLKLLYKGKVLALDSAVAFPSIPNKPPKVMVMASSTQSVSDLNAKRSDPTIRGLDQERKVQVSTPPPFTIWGPDTAQHKQYKFCRFQACTWQSFGHRTGSRTPHAFRAMQLLEQLATDPGIVAILKERELVVGTLGEMDPIDDRLKQKKEQHGACLLGYNTNHGLRIDLKLRTNDLQDFLPYPQIASTLIHELSHNWVGEHNLLFWTNFGQMRVEYLYTHATLAATGYVAQGKTTSEIAGLHLPSRDLENSILALVMQELQKEMVQHGLSPNSIAPAIRERCREIAIQKPVLGQVVGGVHRTSTTGTARELALAAAERRAKQQERQGETKEEDKHSS